MSTFEIVNIGSAAKVLINGQDISDILLSYEVSANGGGRPTITLRLLGNFAMKVAGAESSRQKGGDPLSPVSAG